MNTEQYEEYKQKIPDFEQLYVREVPLLSVRFDHLNTQIRQKGHVVSAVPALAESILQNGQQIPVTVRSLSNGNYELKDGATRYLACLENKMDKIKISNYFDSTSPTPVEWFVHQCRQNDHNICTTNSIDDMKSQIKTMSDKGYFDQIVGFKYQQDQEKYVEKCVDYVKTHLYPNSGPAKKKIKGYVEKSLTSAIGTSYEQYTKNTAMAFIKSKNPWSWQGKGTKAGIGEISNNVAVYVPTKMAELKTNTLGNAGYKKIDNPKTKLYVVYYIGNLASMNDKKIKDARDAVIKEYKKINNAYNIFAGLYFLPQIKTGANLESLTTMIKAV